ncbi:MAG: cytochrome d ubiquinol oxidase subunit II [Myxococcales bacterium]
MATLWFGLLAAMLAAYVVLDGFDLGAGALHLAVARTPAERQLALRAVGPHWDGNEVWLLAAGGVLFLAFPPVYASAFSGFYLPLMLVLWLLTGRGVALELRGQLEAPIWRAFWDAVYCLSSGALALVFGVALGNVLRGVPLDAAGDFFVPFWTDWRPSPAPGALDWYTVLVGLLAVAALSLHGGCFLALRTTGELQVRARRLAALCLGATLGLTAAALPATALVRPASLDGFRRGPFGALFTLIALVGLGACAFSLWRRREGAAFLGSSAYLASMLGSAAVGLHPWLLPSSGPPGLGLAVEATASSPHALAVGLAWWIPGTALAAGYFALSFRLFRGKVDGEGGYG